MLLHRVSVLSVLLLSLGGVVALANPNSNFLTPTLAQNFEGQQRPHWGKQRLMQELNLTPEQEQKLQDIRSQYKDQISQRQQVLRQATQEFASLMASNADSSQIRAKHQQVQQLRQELEDLRFESMLAMRDVLTSDQRSRFAQLMEQRREEFRNPMRQRRGQDF
ncbi:MAG TPA: Spy protein [Cyanobacteria bacterium UBA8803]|nr:Spy protein [Cyanobacteria bacterium UBA9273]HBL58627.1 Spy protein [Cyanobacteria bacterium UBA8803]